MSWKSYDFHFSRSLPLLFHPPPDHIDIWSGSNKSANQGIPSSSFFLIETCFWDCNSCLVIHFSCFHHPVYFVSSYNIRQVRRGLTVSLEILALLFIVPFLRSAPSQQGSCNFASLRQQNFCNWSVNKWFILLSIFRFKCHNHSS